MNQSELDYMNAQMRIQEFHREAERDHLLRLAKRARLEERGETSRLPAFRRVTAHFAGHALEAAGRRLLEAGERLHGQIHAQDPQPCPGETA